MTRTASYSQPWMAGFLAAFDEEGLVTRACRKVKVGRSTVYDARKTDLVFAAAWDETEEIVTERMEAEAMRRATDGVERKVWHQGDEIGTERIYSDTLLIFMLKARRPEVYRDNVKIVHSGNVGVDLSSKTDAELERLAGCLDAKRERRPPRQRDPHRGRTL